MENRRQTKYDHSECNGRCVPDPGNQDKRKALQELSGSGEIEVLVDNETAVRKRDEDGGEFQGLP